MITLLLFGTFFILVFLNVPIAISLGLASIGVLLYDNGLHALGLLPSIMYASISSFTLLAIPFFILAGVIMDYAGISKRLIEFANVCVGHRKNGIVLVTVITALFFAAISGSGPATVAAIGAILIPALIKSGYPKSISAALIASSGSIGIIIPPSIAFIVFAVVANDLVPITISRLFIAGIIPGLLLAVALVVATMFVTRTTVRQTDLPMDAEVASAVNLEKKNSWSEVGSAFYKAIWGLLIPVIILGGIYGGIFTPTEAAVVAVFYALVVGLFLYRDLKLKHLPNILVDASVQTAVVMLIVGAASVFSYIITTQRIAQTISEAMLGITESKILILLMVTVILLIIGAFIDAISAFYLLVPILLPVMLQIGVDPTTFGVFMTVNLAIGLFTPPVGLNLYVACGIANISLKDITKGIMPFLIASIVVLLLITFIPALSNWLPDLLNM